MAFLLQFKFSNIKPRQSVRSDILESGGAGSILSLTSWHRQPNVLALSLEEQLWSGRQLFLRKGLQLEEEL